MRALVLSAPVGESHAAMARSLADDLQRCPDVTSAAVLNDFSVLGSTLGRLLERGFRRHLGDARRSYDVAYWLFTRVAPARRFGEEALYRLGGSALQATIAAHEPDVVVSTHPVLNPVLARLRAAGRLGCPAAAVVGPLGGLGFWVHPSLDLHLLNYPEALHGVERQAGRGRAVPVRPLVREAFESPPARDDARDALGIPLQRRVVLVSGGGWGAGDLDGAIGACLDVGDVDVIAVTGRNEPLRKGLVQRHRGDSRVTVLGFTDHMPTLLSAADAHVTATAGLSCLEARLCGCPTVCYGFAVGHVRDNTRALARHRLARTAATPTELTAELRAALAEGREAVGSPSDLPRAAEITAALARRHATSGLQRGAGQR